MYLRTYIRMYIYVSSMQCGLAHFLKRIGFRLEFLLPSSDALPLQSGNVPQYNLVGYVHRPLYAKCTSPDGNT